MNQADERDQASGLLHELDGLRSLLDEHEQAMASAPATARDYPPTEAAGAADDVIPLLDDAIDLPEVEIPVLEDVIEPVVFGDGETVTERLVARGLDAAIQARIDATFEHWVQETLQVELALLRARLQDAVKTEIEAFVSQEIRRHTATGKPHGE
jgi:hypothetical protein